MFAFLRGQIARKLPQHIELDVHGVGYLVWVPERLQRKLTVDDTVTLLTYCYIREEAFTIFGFLKEEERALFRTLLGVSHVGPKVALALMSALSVQEFAEALRTNDITTITKADGVGKKMAQRIVLEMKTKLGQDAELSAILGEGQDGDAASPDTDDVIAALCALGCTLGEAKRAADKARANLGADAPDEELVKAALRTISRL